MNNEYRDLPQEFTAPPDEFREGTGQRIPDKKIKEKHRFRLVQKSVAKMMCGSVVTVSLLAAAVSNSPSIQKNNTSHNDTLTNANSNVTIISKDISSKDSSSDRETISSSREPLVKYETVTCDECNGYGIICPGAPEFGLDRGNANGYPGCGGTGYSKCPDMNCDNGTYTCPDCKGTGIDKYGNKCEICTGRGVYPHEEFCMGTGICRCISEADHYFCEKCFGKGTVVVLIEN